MCTKNSYPAIEFKNVLIKKNYELVRLQNNNYYCDDLDKSFASENYMSKDINSSKNYNDKSISISILPKNFNHLCNYKINNSYNYILPRYCCDKNTIIDNSESFDETSYIDIKLVSLHDKLKAEVEEIRKWKQDTTLNTNKKSKKLSKNNSIHKEIDSKSILKSKLQILESKIDQEIARKNNAIKENVRLKKQQTELKNQMTMLMKFINSSQIESCSKDKIINEFQEDHERLSKITGNLKFLIDENKGIFKDINEELNFRNEKLFETIEHAKFLQEKLNLRESQYQNLRNQLETLNSDFNLIQISSRNIQNDLSIRNKELFNSNLNMSKQLDFITNKNNEFWNQIKSRHLECTALEKSKKELEIKLDNLLAQYADYKISKDYLENVIKSLNQKLEEDSKIIEHKDKVINEINDALLILKDEKLTIQNKLIQLEKDFIECSFKTEREYNNLETKYVQDSIQLRDKVKELTNQSETNSRIIDQTFVNKNKEIDNLEKQIIKLKQEKAEIIEYLYKLPPSSIKWNHFFQ